MESRLASGLRTIVLLLSLFTSRVAVGAGLLGGTVVSIDVESLELVLQMPQGHTALYAVAAAGVLKDLKVGDRISIELDQAGKIVKLVKLPLDPGN